MEAGDGATGDGDGDEGPDRAAQYRAAAVDELGHGGELDLGLMQMTPITRAPNTPIFIKLEM